MSTFFIKASSYNMVEQNSRHADSFWYSVEHAASKLSVFHLLFNAERPPFMDDIDGVCHGDELMYLFDVNLPIVICNTEKFFGEKRNLSSK